ncbi:hypothetical protein [Parasphingorhabdus cellanae]|uniref:Uncharacterized protein n=1 Tax=Parasphingorhabdus cellanae TaxID=2806553 RepID=A0ABX7T6Q6_9SPHN|nr:hypothetical protein [Parasphingorhabdus cellanae]QTD57211.1 hypothetical protein J4G78_06615 [Parasphingorhabdus cellanae]
MATVNDNTETASETQSRKGRIALYILALFVLILAAVFAYNYSFIKGQLGIGTAYGARVACSCHYVGGRDLADCEKDFEPGMEVIGLSIDDDKRRVTASVPLLASATAEFREGWGCVMLTEAEAD